MKPAKEESVEHTVKELGHEGLSAMPPSVFPCSLPCPPLP